jgi:small-conductance mechanosensitive channel
MKSFAIYIIIILLALPVIGRAQQDSAAAPSSTASLQAADTALQAADTIHKEKDSATAKKPEKKTSADTTEETKDKPEENAAKKKSDTKTDNKKTTKTEKKKNELSPPSIKDLISLPKVFWSIIFIFVGYLFIRIISSILDKFAERSTNYRITIKGLIPIIRIFGWIAIVYVIIAGVIRPPMATIIAVSASIGVAVGFAAQDVLKNVFGGIMILLDRPFQVGDKIEIESFYGEVVKIGLRSTRIVTPDDSLVSIPNGDLMNKSVSNANTGEANCQVVAEVYLPIDIDTNLVRQIATETAQVSRYIYLDKPIAVLFFNEVKYHRSWFKMRLKAYVMDIRFEFAFKSDMTEKIIKELLDRNIISKKDLI